MPEKREPFLRVTWTDPVTGRKGYVVIDRLIDGIAGGGTRMRAGLTMEEVERLARTMSIKNGAVRLPSGGAKGGVDIDPHDPEARALLTRFVRAMRPLLETWWATAEDMGTTQDLLNEVFQEVGMRASVEASLNHSGDADAALARLAKGLSTKVGGIGMGDLVGGYGVAAAAAAAVAHRSGRLTGMRASVQGFGAMGGSTARYLDEQGVKVVAIADVKGTVANPNGLDVERLLATRTALGDIERAELGSSDRQLEREAWLAADAEILVPAAVADAITDQNAGEVRASFVVEAANIPTTEAAQAALRDRGVTVVPDFVANGGTNAWFWWVLLGRVDPAPEPSFAMISETISRTVRDLLSISDREGVTPRQAAEKVAEANLDELEREFAVAT
ncbi:MAG TPA: Glu/Leu/Phe/Val dehydrogenase dimerization domain-containing protein [Candidatus Dormibacteraeota bacterium]|nr:Glu/Leu/Phe/Val dehydrogenase dimerization domain-containing protein [Candidatus Dormibacteraeota bacterium]